MSVVERGDIQTYYERQGDGPPVVCIHGLGWDHRSWRPQMAALGGAYEMIAYDYRGHGNTDASAMTEYSISLLADDLRALTEELELEQPVLCAHSFGGLIAAEYAIQYSDDVTGLVFADARTDVGETTFEQVMFRVYPVFRRLEAVVGRERIDRVMELISDTFSDAEQGSDAEVAELGMTPSEYVDEVSESFSREEGDKFLQAGRGYIGTNPTDFAVPVLYTYGELTSNVIAGKADRLERAPTDVRVREIEDAGHGVMLEQPEAFTEALHAFLADVTGERKVTYSDADD